MCLYLIPGKKTGTNIVNVSEKLSPNQQRIINAIKDNQKITNTELSKLVGIAPTNIAENKEISPV